MGKKNNSENDKMLDDILNDFDDPNNRQPRGTANRNRNVRSSSGSNIPRKSVNPSSVSDNNPSGFAVSRTSDNMEATKCMPVPESDTDGYGSMFDTTAGSYQEYTLNIKRPAVYDEPQTEKTNYSENAEYNQGRPPRRKRRRKKSARLPVVLMVTTLIFTVAIVLSILIISVGRDMLAIGKNDSKKMVTITEGADAETVARILEEEGIIDIPEAFEIIAKLNDADVTFIPGQYELSPSDAYETIINKLTTKETNDNRETVNITFVEGISIYDAAKLLAENNVCDAERFIYYFNAGGFGFDFESKLPTSTASKFYRMEGYLFPDTYTFYVDSEPESVCMKIYQNFENKMTEEFYKQMQRKNMTLDEVITLASIVQAEAADPDEMKKIAAVFENRLSNPDKFPKLQSDPTKYYVRDVIKPNIQVPSTAIFDAYNTYEGNGLPPGAIGNPGLAAIEAVLYPSSNNYYYFAADIDTLEVYYAETLDEHEHNLAVINGEISDDEGADEDYNYEDYDDYDDDYYYE